MKIGFISDTHGGYNDVLKAFEILNDCKYIVHLGDVLYHGPRNDIPETYAPKKLVEFLKSKNNVYYVKGNCDSDVDEMVLGVDLSKKSRVLDFDGLRIFAIHGYEESIEDRIKMAKDENCDILAFGHTHVKVEDRVDNLVVLNPGSTTIPKDGSKSVAIYEDGNLRFIKF